MCSKFLFLKGKTAVFYVEKLADLKMRDYNDDM